MRTQTVYPASAHRVVSPPLLCLVVSETVQKRTTMRACARRIARARFIPPWERAGAASVEAYFNGAPRSTADATTASAPEATDAPVAPTPAADESEAPSPLPYGAVAAPGAHRGADDLPAWGQYMQSVHAMGAASPELQSQHPTAAGYTGAQAQHLLANDYNTKLPYKFDALPPMRSAATPQWPLHGTCGLVLDIDGVVYAGGRIIDGSADAIRELARLKIPFVFMTNGGGTTEARRARQLSAMLGTTIDEAQVIVAHTPMRHLAERYEDVPVLIAGPHPTSLEAARAYGFKRAVSLHALQLEHPELVPLKLWDSADREAVAARKQALIRDPTGRKPLPEFAAIFVFNDKNFDGLSDVQVITDVVTSPYGHISGAVAARQTVPIYMAADDLLWPAQAPLPRLGQGAIREMLSAVYESVTGHELQVTQFGKPRRVAYECGLRALKARSAKLGWDPAVLRAACMVGDNKETDIIGANAYGAPFVSVHVLSGVGSAPSAVRTVAPNDAEGRWLQEHASPVPHYVAPTLDHFVRELQHFDEQAVVANRDAAPRPVEPCPVDLQSVYNIPL